MACKCTEDFKQFGNVRIGRNKVTCQECLDTQVIMQKKREIEEKKQALIQIEISNLRKLYDGEDLTAINTQRIALRSDVSTKISEVEALNAVKDLKAEEEKV